MILLRALSRCHAWLAVSLLLLAMAARAAVPAGYMPRVLADGTFGIIPCEGTASPAPMSAMGLMADMHHSNGGSHDQHHADQPCAFAGLAAPLLPPESAAEPARRALGLDMLASMADLPLRLRAPKLRPPSRAPPLFV